MFKKLTVVLSALALTGGVLSGCSTTSGSNIAAPIEVADTSAIQQDLQNALLFVTTQLASNPTSHDLSTIKPAATSIDTTITVSGGWDDYKIIAVNTKYDGSIVYDSTTGQTINTLVLKPANG
jgi:hypothetical protein